MSSCDKFQINKSSSAGRPFFYDVEIFRRKKHKMNDSETIRLLFSKELYRSRSLSDCSSSDAYRSENQLSLFSTTVSIWDSSYPNCMISLSFVPLCDFVVPINIRASRIFVFPWALSPYRILVFRIKFQIKKIIISVIFQLQRFDNHNFPI